MLRVQNMNTCQSIRWHRDAFVYVRTMGYKDQLNFDVMTT